MTQTTQTVDSDKATAVKAAAKIRAMQPSKRSAAFKKLPAHIQLLATEPCPGQAHDVTADGCGFIDGCMCCVNYTWGRTLLRTEEQKSRFPEHMR